MRTRAGSFALAFGVRDLCWGVVYGTATLGIWRGALGIEPSDPDDPLYVIYLCGTLFAVPLIAYGILRAHLFDIDLRLRWTIKQSTLAAMIAAIVYLLSEGASRFLSTELGNIAGLIAAALVVYFLAPLQRLAERVASAAMPNTHSTPEYAAFRKLQVYEAAVAEVLPGGISDRIDCCSMACAIRWVSPSTTPRRSSTTRRRASETPPPTASPGTTRVTWDTLRRSPPGAFVDPYR